MPGEQTCPYKGYISAITGSVTTPATSPCAACSPASSRPAAFGLMSPGMYVRIRLPLDPPRPALLVSIGPFNSDKGRKYVYVVNAANKTEIRQVVTGAASSQTVSARSRAA